MTNDQMVNWVHHFEEVRLSNKAKEKMMKSQQLVLELLHSHQTVYGVNTGFGSLSTEKINENDRPFHDDKKKTYRTH